MPNMQDIKLLEMPYDRDKTLNSRSFALARVKDKTFSMYYDWYRNTLIFYKFEPQKDHIIRPRPLEYTYLYGNRWWRSNAGLDLDYRTLLKSINRYLNYFQCMDDPFIWHSIEALIKHPHISGGIPAKNSALPELDGVEKFMLFLNNKPFIWTEPLNAKLYDMVADYVLLNREILHSSRLKESKVMGNH
jgi:hypothetical protein